MNNFNLLSDRLKWAISEKEVRENRRIYQAEITTLFSPKISRAAVNNWFQDKNGIDAKYARPLSEFLNVDPIWLETGDGKHERKKADALKEKGELIDLDDGNETVGIKRVEFKISAGISGFSVEYLNGEKSPISFRKDWLEKKGYFSQKLYAIEVKGQSMEPKLFAGDLVVINTADTKHVDGGAYAFNYDGECVIKRLFKEGGNWYLASDNLDKSRFPNKKCDESCFVIGRVIYKQTEEI
jgi:phage repressor protein C with HTH and peptisase S24 domain